MSFLSSWILLNVFTALLPPTDPNEEDYYSRLGLDRRKKVTADEIRRAFRSKSLQWHPDKIAQRRDQDISASEAAAKFQGIQEAYQVLSDSEKRKDYHFWNCSVARYQFVHSNMANPSTLYHNLASARVRDKGRLIAVISVLIIILILPFILIAAKVNQTLEDKGGLKDASWAALLTPIWAAFVLSFASVGLVMYLTRKVTLAQIVGLMERACWMSAIVLLVQRWDGNRIIENWHASSMPFYFAVAFRVLGQFIWIGTVQEEIKKMISVEHLQTVEAEMFSGMTIEDLQEEELAALHDRYRVVNPDPLHVVSALEILKAQGIDLRAPGQEKELEQVRVQCSPEYQAASEQISDARVYTINMILFGVPLIPLTAAKLNGDITASWWVVIMPLWVFWGVRMVWVCALCFGFGAGESVVMVDAEDEDEEKEAGDTTGDVTPTQEVETPTTQDINKDTIAEKNLDSAVEDEEQDVEENGTGSSDNVFPTPYNMP